VRVAKERQVDLIVISSHGRKGLGRMLFGSTAEQVVRHAPCPVLVVKPPHEEGGQ
jgi:nucleotide-binding universal stress UspA family protein